MQTDTTALARQIGPAIDVLAAKLKMPSEFVWDAMIRQVYVSFAMWSIAFAVVLVVDRLLVKRWKREHEKDRGAYDEDIAGAISGIAAGIATFIVGLCWFNSVGGVLNPAYAALSMILAAVK